MIDFKAFHKKADWQNIQVTSINREQSHTPWAAWDNEANAVGCAYGTSPYIKSLDGKYRFRLYPNPEAADDFFLPGYDDSGFSDINVPGNWETQGFGEPIYTNISYPWKTDINENCIIRPSVSGMRLPNPPHIPFDNPTGCYLTRFTIPQQFAGREVFLCFDGVETAFYVWVNGQPIGYSQDSKLPAEFNITGHIKDGENLLAVMAMKLADSSYVEDQDYWYLAGIYRSVRLVSKPKLRINDYKITSIPDLHTGDGHISIDVTVSREEFFADCLVKAAVYYDGQKIAEGTGKVNHDAQYRTDTVPTANTARISLTVKDIKLWSPDTPVLYKLVITLTGSGGNVLDIESCHTGFKLVEIQNGIVMLNGRRLIVRGVNRHEHYWETGRTVTAEHMLDEIRQMKRMNINAVRTCHYPDMPQWYELCDMHGILLVCECNAETHGVAGALSHNPQWADVFLERAVRMVQTYKNHVSIFSWSLGNESGTGANHAAMYGFIKEYDNTRLCQYEAGHPGKNISDIRGQMYATVSDIMKMLSDPRDDRPVIPVEFLYQIRNSGGGMEHFVRLLDNYPRFQGGFIWDWQDKSLAGSTDEGEEYFAYGGDFGESFVEGDAPYYHPPFMTNNGIVLPDLTWKPVAYEVKQAYCPVTLSKPASIWSPAGENVYIIKQMPDCRPYHIVAILREDGAEIAQEPVTLPQTPEFTFEMEYDKIPGKIYTIEFSVRQSGDTFYAGDGYQLGLFQFPLSGKPRIPCADPVSNLPVSLTDKNNNYAVSGKDFEITFSKEIGEVVSFIKNGTNIISGGTPVLNRPYTGLDAYKRWGWHDEYQKIRNLSFRVSSSHILKADNIVCAEFSFIPEESLFYDVSFTVRYTMRGTGVLDVEFSADIDEACRAVPRAGLEYVIPAGFEALSYFGLGPGENYSDRKLSAYLALHHCNVSDLFFPFNPPSECGGHEDTRRIMLTNDDNVSLHIESQASFHFDIHHSRIEDFINAAHSHEIEKHPESYLHIDAAHGPIGGEMAWSTVNPKEYNLRGGHYHLAFSIR